MMVTVVSFVARFGANDGAETVANIPVLFRSGNMNQTGPVTIGGLRHDSRLLEAGCHACRHWCYLDPRGLPFADHEPVPTFFPPLAVQQVRR